jgi:hypothetical protein
LSYDSEKFKQLRSLLEILIKTMDPKDYFSLIETFYVSNKSIEEKWRILSDLLEVKLENNKIS